MTVWYLVSIAKKRNDVADTAWGLGFILVVFLNLIINSSLKLLVSAVLITVWGVRLAIHIYKRNKDKKEDVRYEQFKKSPYAKVFLTQGFLMWMICWPVMLSSGDFHWFNFLGVVIWLVGFYFELRADKELKDFISNKNNKGKIMQAGLWAYSRHPNYFGEVTMWWGIWLLNFNSSWISVVGPLTITFLILKVSGVPLLEKRYAGREGWEEYKNKTSVFIPWWPKK